MKTLIIYLLLLSTKYLVGVNVVTVKPDTDSNFQFTLEAPEEFTVHAQLSSLMFEDRTKHKVGIIHFEKKNKESQFEETWAKTLKELDSDFPKAQKIENTPLQFPQMPQLISTRVITLQTAKNPPLGFVRLILLETNDHLYRLSVGNDNSLEELNQLSQTIASQLSLSKLSLEKNPHTAS